MTRENQIAEVGGELSCRSLNCAQIDSGEIKCRKKKSNIPTAKKRKTRLTQPLSNAMAGCMSAARGRWI
jgi:hypothetical protein